MRVADAIEELRLVDQHLHPVLPGPLKRPDFERYLTESDRPARPGTTEGGPGGLPPGRSHFDSQLGFAVRRWCAPALGLDPCADPDVYLERRNRVTGSRLALLSAANCAHLLVDTGYAAPGSVGLAELAALSGAQVREVVRLEAVAGELVTSGCAAAEFADRYRERLWQRTAEAAGVKSIIAYRHGLDFDPARPTSAEVTAAAGRWLDMGNARLTDPVLLRFVLWSGVDRGLPVQLHTGFGDPDLDLRRADPLLCRDFLAAADDAGVPVVLLHCYPFHRHAAWLAQAYPHVYVDLGLAVNHVGARASAVLAEALELAPFAQVMYSSDAFGLPELVYLGARLWRTATSEVLGGWVAAGQWAEPDAIRVAAMIGAGTASRLYRLPGAALSR